MIRLTVETVKKIHDYLIETEGGDPKKTARRSKKQSLWAGRWRIRERAIWALPFLKYEPTQPPFLSHNATRVQYS